LLKAIEGPLRSTKIDGDFGVTGAGLGLGGEGLASRVLVNVQRTV